MALFVPDRDRAPSLLSAAALGAFAVGFLRLAYDYPPGPRTFPLMIGWTMVVLVALDVLSHTDTMLGRLIAAAVGKGEAGAQTGSAARAPAWFALLWIPAYAVMVYLIGFLPTAAVYMFVSTAVFGPARPLSAALQAAALTAVLWLFFERALGFTLFRGVLLEPFL